MNINISSELMKNQQHAVVMGPNDQFEVLQTTDGNSLFFSIGSDNNFYVTREATTNSLGWDQVNLSSGLSSAHNNETVTAKTFDASQAPAAGAIDLALVVTVSGVDYLYLALGVAATDAAWENGVTWAAVPYDGAQSYTTFTIEDVYVAETGGTEYIIADVIGNATTQILYRYFIDPTMQLTTKAWNQRDLSGNLQAGNITNCLGCKAGELSDGIYTMGSIGGKEEILYTPLYNPFNISIAPMPSNFVMPTGATAMALSVNSAGYTDLFVAAAGTLCFLAADAQVNGATPAVVYTHALLTGVQSLHVNNSNNLVVVWGFNNQGQLFYLQTTPGNETNTAMWSCPIPIAAGVMNVATFINSNAENNVIFAHISDNTLLQLTQDPVTTGWQERSILLPSTDASDYVETYTYTTRIQFTDGNNLPLGNTTATIAGTSPCSVYINNNYSILSVTTPLQVTSDACGVLNIVQQVDSISAVCYQLIAGGVTQSINPMINVIARLQNVQSASNLQVNVTDEMGNSTPLVSTSISTTQLGDAASGIAQFVQVNAGMPADGTLQSAAGSNNTAFLIGGTGSVNGSTPDFSNAIDAAAGDIWRWMKSAAQDVENVWIQVEGAVTHFFIQIGGDMYHIIINCMADVANGIEFVMGRIAVAIDDMVKWIGFIFSWNDIVVTHRVMRNILLQYAGNCVNTVDDIITAIDNDFKNLKSNINKWAGMPTMTNTYGSVSSAPGSVSGTDTPQAHWGLYHTQNNAGAAQLIYTPPSDTSSSTIQQVLGQLLAMMQKEGHIIEHAFTKVKALIDNLSSLTVTEIIQQVIAIITDSVLSTAENGITTALSIFGELTQGLVDALKSPLNIPVISPLYQEYAGDPLSILDLACLVGAIPATIVYKLIYQQPPFDATDPVTQSLMNATDFAAIQAACNSSSVNAAPFMGVTATPSASASAVPSGGITAAPVAGLSTIDKIGVIANTMGFIGALGQSILTIAKNGSPDNPVLAGISAIFYLPYVAPDVIGSLNQIADQKWYAIMNQDVACVAVMKAGVDVIFYSKNIGFGATWQPVSPWADAIINLIWQAPTCGALFYSENENAAGAVNFIGGTLFDISGVVSPEIASGVQPGAGIATAAAVIANFGYGCCCLALVDATTTGHGSNNVAAAVQANFSEPV